MKIRYHFNTLPLLVLLGTAAAADAQVQSKLAQRWFEEATKLPTPFRLEVVQQHTVGGSGRGFEISDKGRLRFASCEPRLSGQQGRQHMV